ncbi:MAG: energy-coupling factor ABC transporter permease [Actinomycetota bacterium]
MFFPKMHIPDGFISLPTSALFGLISIGFVGLALKGAAKSLDDRTTPLAGLTAVFIFAAQMINFPVAAGTSGHLLGAALATALVGPYSATLAITVVLGVQGLLFADGGLTALGLNIFNMAVFGVWSSYLVILLLRKLLSQSKLSFAISAGVAAFISVPVAATGFCIQYALGGIGTISVATVTTAMLGTHLLIGIGEAVITFMTVYSVIRTRSDLVYGWKEKLEIKA